MKDKDYLIYKPKPMYSLDADLESPSYFKTVPASLMPKEPEQLKAEPEVTCPLIRSLVFVYYTGWTSPLPSKYVYWGGKVDSGMFDKVQQTQNFIYHGPLAAMNTLIGMLPDPVYGHKFVQITYAEALKRTGNTRLFTPVVL